MEQYFCMWVWWMDNCSGRIKHTWHIIFLWPPWYELALGDGEMITFWYHAPSVQFSSRAIWYMLFYFIYIRVLAVVVDIRDIVEDIMWSANDDVKIQYPTIPKRGNESSILYIFLSFSVKNTSDFHLFYLACTFFLPFLWTFGYLV